MKEKYHNVGTVPQSYREIVEGGQTDTTNTHIHDLSRYWLQSYIKLANRHCSGHNSIGHSVHDNLSQVFFCQPFSLVKLKFRCTEV